MERIEITRERALAILAAHGGDPARWPPLERAGLAALVERDAEVAAACAEQRRLDDLLGALCDSASDTAVLERIQARAVLSAPRAPARPPRLLMACALALGLGGGAIGTLAYAQSAQDEALVAQFASAIGSDAGDFE